MKDQRDEGAMRDARNVHWLNTVVQWKFADSDLVGACRTARQVLSHSTDLLGIDSTEVDQHGIKREEVDQHGIKQEKEREWKVGEIDPVAVAAAVRNLCRQRCTYNPVLRIRQDDASALGILFVAESHLMLHLADRQRADALDDGTRLGQMLKETCSRTFNAQPLNEAIRIGLDELQSDRMPNSFDTQCANGMQLAFGVVFMTEKNRPTWKEVCTAEVLSADRCARAMIQDLIRDTERPADVDRHHPVSTETMNHHQDPLGNWIEECASMQHSDELLTENCDLLLWMNMYGAEVQAPETVRVFEQAKPRSGYHWFSRLRACRSPEKVDILYERCNRRTAALEPAERANIPLCYMEYFMRHSGVASWRALCFFDDRHGTEALAALVARQCTPVGQPRMPPFIIHTASAFVLMHGGASSAELRRISSHDTLAHAIHAWCAFMLRVTDGMMAPRISCRGLLERILGLETDRVDQINLEEELHHADHIADLDPLDLDLLVGGRHENLLDPALLSVL